MKKLVLFISWIAILYSCSLKQNIFTARNCKPLKGFISENWQREAGKDFGVIADEAIQKIRTDFKGCLQLMSPEDVIDAFGPPSKHPYVKGSESIKYSLDKECPGYGQCKYMVFFIITESNTIYDIRTFTYDSE